MAPATKGPTSIPPPRGVTITGTERRLTSGERSISVGSVIKIELSEPTSPPAAVDVREQAAIWGCVVMVISKGQTPTLRRHARALGYHSAIHANGQPDTQLHSLSITEDAIPDDGVGVQRVMVSGSKGLREASCRPCVLGRSPVAKANMARKAREEVTVERREQTAHTRA